jgi:hypothetical protein
VFSVTNTCFSVTQTHHTYLFCGIYVERNNQWGPALIVSTYTINFLLPSSGSKSNRTSGLNRNNFKKNSINSNNSVIQILNVSKIFLGVKDGTISPLHGAYPLSISWQFLSYERDRTPRFVEPDVPLPCSQRPEIRPYPELRLQGTHKKKWKLKGTERKGLKIYSLHFIFESCVELLHQWRHCSADSSYGVKMSPALLELN